MNFRDLSRNCLAWDKALYEGHAVAAVAASSQSIADAAIALIDVKYEVLPYVIDVEDAMADNAPVLHDDLFTAGVEPKPTQPSNIAKVVTFKKGDVDAGFKDADVIVEGRYTTKAVHQAYIEPHACLCSYNSDGQVMIYSSSQGHFMVRAYCSKLLGIDLANIRAVALEIGGGFGGKTLVYLEPVAIALSKKSGRPVKMQMTRDEVFRASGPTSGATIEVKLGAKKDGSIVAAKQVLKYQAGAFPGSPIGPGCMCGLAMYDIPNVDVVGYDVVSNRPKVAAYRAPGAPISSFAVESAVDDLARKLGKDPIALREQNGARNGTKTHYGPTHQNIGFLATLEAAKNHPHWKAPLKPGQGRGIACGFWFNIGGESSAGCHIAEDGTVVATSGNPDIGGSRASIGMMVAEVLGVPAESGAHDHPRHVVDQLQLPHGWVARDVRHRHGGDSGGRARGGGPEDAAPRRSGKSRSTRWSGRTARRTRPVPTPARSSRWISPRWRRRRGAPAGLSAPRCPSTPRAPGRASACTSATWKWTARPAGEDPALYGGAGCRQGDPPQLRGRSDPGRCDTGHRLGAERGVHLRRQGEDG